MAVTKMICSKTLKHKGVIYRANTVFEVSSDDVAIVQAVGSVIVVEAKADTKTDKASTNKKSKKV